MCCVVVCDLETSRMGAPYIYDISRLRVNNYCISRNCVTWQRTNYELPEDDTVVSKHVVRVHGTGTKTIEGTYRQRYNERREVAEYNMKIGRTLWSTM